MSYLVKFLYIVFPGVFLISVYGDEHPLVKENEVIVERALSTFQCRSSRVASEVFQLVEEGRGEQPDQQTQRLKVFLEEKGPKFSHPDTKRVEIYLYTQLITAWKKSFVEYFIEHERLNKIFLRAFCDAAVTEEELAKKRGSRVVHFALKQQENDLIALAVATFPASLLDEENLSFVTPILIQTLSDQNLLKLVNLQKDWEGRNFANLVARNLYLRGWRLKLIHLHPLKTLPKWY